EPDLHEFTSQKNAAAPTTRSPASMSGIAVTSIRRDWPSGPRIGNAPGAGVRRRRFVGGDRRAVAVGREPLRGPLARRLLAGFLEPHPEHALRGLVVEDERS